MKSFKRLSIPLLGVSLLASTAAFSQVKVGNNPNTINPSAALEVESTAQGFLPPRLDIPNLELAAPVTNPAKGLMAYNTNVSSGEGLVYWDGTLWRRFQQNVGPLNLSIHAAGSLYLGDISGISDGNYPIQAGAYGFDNVTWGGGWQGNQGSASWKVKFKTPIPANKTYYVLMTPRSSSNQAQPGNQADLDNDLTPPIIVGKNPTDFTIFLQESAGTQQQLFMDVIVLIQN